MPPTVTAAVVDRFRALPATCVGDALRGLGLRCVETGLAPLDPRWRICGPAVTMRLVPIQDPSRWYAEERSPQEVARLARPGDVLVVDQGGDLEHALWGGIAAGRDAVASGLGGVVIDGPCRDRLAVREAGVPTFVRGTTLRHGHGVYATTCVTSERVRIGSISVGPGDLVVGDLDGIAVVPPHRLDEVLANAERLHELEAPPDPDTPEEATRRARLREQLYGLVPRPTH